MKPLKAIRLLSIKALIVLCFSVLFQSTQAQTVPAGINYQAALRDAKGNPIADSTLTMDVWIRQGNINGEIVFKEEHAITTNTIGLFNVIIGSGRSDTRLDDIAWNKGPYFLELLMNGESFSVTQLLSVPYAMHAASASKIYDLETPTDPQDPTTKYYVDSIVLEATSNLSSQTFVDSVVHGATQDLVTQAFVEDELDKVNKIGITSNGDTLYANGTPLIIPGLNANNNPALSSQVCLGGSEDEQVKVFIKQENSTYLIGAESSSRNGDLQSNKGQTDLWIMELDSAFNIVWQTNIGGSNYDHITHLIPLDNGEILLGGTSESNSGDITGNHGAYDIFIALLDKEHTIRWSKCFGGENADFLNDLIRLDDGSILIGGTSFSKNGDIDVNYGDADVLLIKLDPHQETEWHKTYGGLRYESLEKIVVHRDGILLLGETESNNNIVKGNHGGMDIWVVQLDQDGMMINQQCIGSSNNEELHIIKMQNDKLILGGLSFSANWDPANSAAQKNIWVSSLSSDLSNITSRTFGGSGAESIMQILVAKNDLIIAGSSSSFDGDISANFGDDDFLVLRTSNDFDLTGQQNFGGTYSDKLILAQQRSDGFLFAGISESEDHDVSDNNGATDLWMILTDTEFNITTSWHYGGSRMEGIFDVILNEDNSFVLIGTTASDDYGVSGFHGKAGRKRDILILKDRF